MECGRFEGAALVCYFNYYDGWRAFACEGHNMVGKRPIAVLLQAVTYGSNRSTRGDCPWEVNVVDAWQGFLRHRDAWTRAVSAPVRIDIRKEADRGGPRWTRLTRRTGLTGRPGWAGWARYCCLTSN